MEKKSILLITCLFIYLSFSGCKDSVTNPPEEKPPGYQEEIPWPSLSECPWPKYRHDAQNTGRSNLPGPKYGNINWKRDSLFLWNELVIDSTSIFITKGNPGNLCCYDISGNLKWQSQELVGQKSLPTPIITVEGNIISADVQNVYSFSKNGNLNWSFETNSGGWFITGPSIDKEGNIFLLDGYGTLFSLSKTGTLNWKYSSTEFSPSEDAGISFSPDGETIYLLGKNVSVFSFDISNKKINWSVNKGHVRSSPMVDCSGNIYFIAKGSQSNAVFYSYSSSGKERYSYEFVSTWGEIKIDPTIDKAGNVFFAGDSLYSLDYTGKLRWKTSLPEYNSSPLINDRDGNIYLITYNHTLLCVNNSGEIKMSLQYQTPDGITGYSPVIGVDNTLFLSVLALDNSSQNYSLFSIK